MVRRLLYVLTIPIAVALVVMIGLRLGPTVENRFWPIRANQVIKNVHRDARMVRFTRSSTKLRQLSLQSLTAFISTPNDRYVVAIYKDFGPPDEPCTDLRPLSQATALGLGAHDVHYCVELPRTLNADDPVELLVESHHRGLWGLWDLPQTIVEMEVPMETPPAVAVRSAS